MQEGYLNTSPTGSCPRGQRGFGSLQIYKIKYMEMSVKLCISGSQMYTEKTDSRHLLNGHWL